jgi:DhnA family fructose-bisphosphate aldolase class Ia
MKLDLETYSALIEARIFEPESFTRPLLNRPRRTIPGNDGNLLILASDHTARGKISLGSDPLAMADRYTLLERLVSALAAPGVDGVLASADILEELAWLGALDNKLAIGTLNRGGVIGASWELDDRLSAYDADHVLSRGLDGGKTLLRIDYSDPAVPRTLEMVAAQTTKLADHKLMAMIEPLPYIKNESGRAILNTSDEELAKVVAIASGLGSSSAYTWLKIPPRDRMAEIAGATSLPVLMLGGEPEGNPDGIFEQWSNALKLHNVRGLVAGRTLLYPSDGDSNRAIDRAVAIIHPGLSGSKGDLK